MFNVCQSPIVNSYDGKWLTDVFINILMHTLAVIEDNKDLFSTRLDRNFCPACIATAYKKSDSSSHCKSKLMEIWSHPQVKKCWETKQWDECFLFHGLSCGFVNCTNELNLDFFGCFFRLMTFIIWPSSHRTIRTWIPTSVIYEFSG